MPNTYLVLSVEENELIIITLQNYFFTLAKHYFHPPPILVTLFSLFIY